MAQPAPPQTDHERLRRTFGGILITLALSIAGLYWLMARFG
jgi:hypothetical protein